MSGWFKTHRSISDHWLWTDKPFSKGQAWIDLIAHANFKDSQAVIKKRLFDLKRGQQARSEVTLSAHWGWSRDKTRRFLKLLENDGMVIQQKNNSTSIISICNYDSFQCREDIDDTANDTTGDTTGDTADDTSEKHQKNIRKTSDDTQYKNVKKGKKEKNVKNLMEWVPLKGLNINAWSEFEQHRKDIKKPMTHLAKTKAANSICSLSFEDQQTTVDKTIQSGWTGLYPDKAVQAKNTLKDRSDAVREEIFW